MSTVSESEVLSNGYNSALTKQNRFIIKVYGWMTFGLALTGLVALMIYCNPAIMKKVFAGYNFFILLAIELILVIWIIFRINKISVSLAIWSFIIITIINGLTLSSIFLIYPIKLIFNLFLITSGTFGVMSLYGYFTKKDLTSVGNLCFMGLLGIIIAMIVNMFIHNSIFGFITSCLGVLIFVGLTAFDTQEIKNLSQGIRNGKIDAQAGEKYAILGALTLYLDFINLFLKLLKLFKSIIEPENFDSSN